MSIDRTVYWNKETPSSETLKTVAKDFMSNLGFVGDINNHVFFIDIPGKPSHPLKNVPEFSGMTVVKAADELYSSERYIEVYCSDVYTAVITRHADRLTNTIAKGLSELYAQSFNGELE